MKFLTWLLLLGGACLAEDGRPSLLSNEVREKRTGEYRRELAELNKQLAVEAENVELLSKRGDVRLFLGDFEGAVSDFEKEIVIEPSHDAPHWRLGIAYYFAGQDAKSAAQFAKYHQYDGRDRENGIWHFLANARVKGVEEARKEMLEYRAFDREPFPGLYEMFAGRKTGKEVLDDLEKRNLTGNNSVMFFARYYVGLNEQLQGHPDEAKKRISEAMESAAAANPRGGPGYMVEVARLHYDSIAGKGDGGK